MNISILEDINNAFETIKNGGTILYPTDTIWGIGCDAINETAVQKVYEIKKRPTDKSYIILVPNLRQLLKYIASPPLNIDEIIAFFNDRPTTFIFNNAINLPDNVINKDGSVAIRITKDDFCIQLLKKLGNPLISTSANISGEASAETFTLIAETIKTEVDYTVFHRREETKKNAASRIVKIENDGRYDIIRN